jgi:hypothetical protein
MHKRRDERKGIFKMSHYSLTLNRSDHMQKLLLSPQFRI